MEDDYYSILNLDRNCTEDDVKASYRRLCIHYHPDKHTQVNREAAEAIFQKIKKAYDVLIDPQKRTIYDIYGVEGLESEWHVAIRSMNQNEIREAYERIERQRKEEEEERATNPVSATSIEMDASGLLQSDSEIRDILNIPINSFTISQSVDAPLTDHTKANIVCTSVNNNQISTGVLRTTVRHSFSPTSWIEPGLTFGQSPMMTLNGFCRLTNFLFSSFHGGLIRKTPDIVAYDAGVTLGCNLGQDTVVKTDFSLDRTLRASISRTILKCRAEASYTLGLESQRASVHLLRPVTIWGNSKDCFVECSINYDVFDGPELEYGCSKALTDFSRLTAILKLSLSAGVKLNLVLTRGRHNYTFDVVFSEVVEPVAVLYGTAFPVFVYSALHWLVIKPYLRKKREEDTAAKAEELATWLETQREEARGAISLMKESYHKIVQTEQGKGGLVIMQAWYGVFGSANKLIDVTIPLQCLVHNSRLILPDQTKVGMVGFYDMSYGEQKKLSVKYSFRNVMHEVIINDEDTLRIPRQSHKIAGS